MALSILPIPVLIWIIAALIPMRSAAARRTWAALIMIVTVIAIVWAINYGMQHANSWADDGDYPVPAEWAPALFTAVGLGPGALVALLRLALSKPDPAPHYPPPLYYQQPQSPPAYYQPPQSPPPYYQPPQSSVPYQQAPHPPASPAPHAPPLPDHPPTA
ncbi:hypothetical protein ABZ721_36495 [Streptomyces sp. NPDC006733]|uniref:hypothetical protein n=1 Tax=Streptomyces sp. NPDC006733 TaxID=3155460 RepID=UPI003406E5D8